MLVSDVASDWLPLALPRLKDRVELPSTPCNCETELKLVDDISGLWDVQGPGDVAPCDSSLFDDPASLEDAPDAFEDAPAIDRTDEVPLIAIAVIWLELLLTSGEANPIVVLDAWYEPPLDP